MGDQREGGGVARTVEDLEVFRLAHEMTLRIYSVTASFPSDERFGLVSQMRRASASVPANLAEGGGRPHRGEFRRFVGIAKGSIAELRYHLLLARDLGYIRQDDHARLHDGCNRLGKMLVGLERSLR